MLTDNSVVTAYRKYAENYDLAVKFYRLLGLKIGKYRKMTVNALELSKGDIVVELGCGTGLNFALVLGDIGSVGQYTDCRPDLPVVDRLRHCLYRLVKTRHTSKHCHWWRCGCRAARTGLDSCNRQPGPTGFIVVFDHFHMDATTLLGARYLP